LVIKASKIKETKLPRERYKKTHSTEEKGRETEMLITVLVCAIETWKKKKKHLCKVYPVMTKAEFTNKKMPAN